MNRACLLARAVRTAGGRWGCVGLASVLSLAALGTPAADWPQFRGPNRDGHAQGGPELLEAWPDEGPPRLWVYEGLGEGYSSAAVTADSVYLTGIEEGDGWVYALDLDGNLRWKSSYGRDWSRSYRGARTTPTVRNGKLYVMSGYGRAVCFDARSGAEIWAVDTQKTFGARNITWGITESPLVLDDKAIFTPGGPDAGVVALHPDTGETLWTTPDVNDVSGYCSPILIRRGGRDIIVQLTGETLVGIQADNGELLWREARRPTPSHKIQAVAPVYDDGRLYVTAGYGGERGEMYRLSEDGTRLTRQWRDANLDCQHGGVVLIEGRIYGASDRNHRNQWLCLNLEDGAVLAKMRGVGKGSVVQAGGRLYTLGENGTMGLVDPDPENFRLISSFKVPSGGRGPHWAHPSIADGRLYVRHAARLFVYDIAAQ